VPCCGKAPIGTHPPVRRQHVPPRASGRQIKHKAPRPVITRVRPRPGTAPAHPHSHNGSPRRGTACAGSSAVRPGCADSSAGGRMPASGHQGAPPDSVGLLVGRLGDGVGTWRARRAARLARWGRPSPGQVDQALAGPAPPAGSATRTASTTPTSWRVSRSDWASAGWPGCGHGHRRWWAAWWSAGPVTAPALTGSVPGSSGAPCRP